MSRSVGVVIVAYEAFSMLVIAAPSPLYEMLWPGWSKQTTGDGPGPILNRMHKFVVSTTLSKAPWTESTIISGNVVEEIPKLKQRPGKDIILDGSATLVQRLSPELLS